MALQHRSDQAGGRQGVTDLAMCCIAATSIAIATAWFAAALMFVGAFS